MAISVNQRSSMPCCWTVPFAFREFYYDSGSRQPGPDFRPIHKSEWRNWVWEIRSRRRVARSEHKLWFKLKPTHRFWRETSSILRFGGHINFPGTSGRSAFWKIPPCWEHFRSRDNAWFLLDPAQKFIYNFYKFLVFYYYL